MKKKWISMLLAAVMVLQASVPVMAADLSIDVTGQKAVEVKEESRAVEEVRTYFTEEQSITGSETTAFKIPEEDLDFVKNQGSLTLTASFKTTGSGFMGLMSINDAVVHTNNYIDIYINSGNRIGMEIRDYTSGGNQTINKDFYKDVSKSFNDGEWHTVTVQIAKNQFYKIYLDGVEQYSEAASVTTCTDTLANWTPTSVTFGRAIRTANANAWPFSGSMRNVKIYNSAVSEEQILEDHDSTIAPEVVEEYGKDTIKTDEYGIYDRGDFGVNYYRIPALITTSKGTVIAASDERNDTSSDWGNIDTVLRRSTDNGATWSDPIEVIDLKSQPYNNGSQSAFLIDPVIMEQESGEHKGRLWMMVDMFPESSGFFSAQVGSGYVTVDGERYLALYDASGTVYTMREDGVVYDSHGYATDYKVKQNTQMPYHEFGDLYQGDERVGNIFLKSRSAGNDTAPLAIKETSYLWLTYSDDDGVTWSQPRDLNGELKEEWMKFLGTAPGVGLELKNGEHAGRLMFPVYYTNETGVQSSANIYSDDEGVTWHRSKSPNDGRININGVASDSHEMNGLTQLTENQIIELNNGHLMQFMRNTSNGSASAPGKVAVSVSKDGGETWGPVFYTEANEVYCQLSVVHLPDQGDGKERILMSNPGGSGRANGTLRVGVVNEDDTITWETTKLFSPGSYAYSCLSVMNDGMIGVMYEKLSTIKFTSFNMAYLSDPVNIESPMITGVSCQVTRKNETRTSVQPGDTMHITATFDQNVVVTGNPTLRIKVGGKYVYATYASMGKTGKKVVFDYVVQKGDEGSNSFEGPKVMSDSTNAVRNAQGYGASAGNLAVDLGYIGFGGSDVTGVVPRSNVVTATAGNEHDSESAAANVIDDDAGTLWHTDWYGTEALRGDMWIALELDQTYSLNGLRYLPRTGSVNGVISGYQIEVSTDGQTWTKAAEGEWSTADRDWKTVKFDPVEGKYIRLKAVKSLTDSASYVFASAAEIRGMATEFISDDETPDQPENLKVSDITKNSATVSWDETIDNVGVTAYHVSYGIVGQTKETLDLNGESFSVDLTGLTEGQDYEVEVTASDETGNTSTAAKCGFKTAKESFTVTYEAAEGGTITGTAVQTVEKGGSTTEVTAAANEGYEFSGWSDGIAAAARTDSNVTESKTITAQFTKKQVTPVPDPTPNPGDDKPPVTVVTPDSVNLNVKSAISVGLKEKVTLKATVLPAEASQKITWKSSNPAVAAVTAAGKVTAKKKGTATITATAENGKTVTCKVTVKKAPSKLISKIKTRTLKKGKSYKLPVKLPAGAASYKITYKSGKKSVATVSSTGKVTAKKKGSAKITIKTFNGKKAVVKIIVK